MYPSFIVAYAEVRLLLLYFRSSLTRKSKHSNQKIFTLLTDLSFYRMRKQGVQTKNAKKNYKAKHLVAILIPTRNNFQPLEVSFNFSLYRENIIAFVFANFVTPMSTFT